MLGRQRRRLHEAALDVLLSKGDAFGPLASDGGADPAMVAHHARGGLRAVGEGRALLQQRGQAHSRQVELVGQRQGAVGPVQCGVDVVAQVAIRTLRAGASAANNGGVVNEKVPAPITAP
jgi:hypothetical protein